MNVIERRKLAASILGWSILLGITSMMGLGVYATALIMVRVFG